MVKSDDHSHHHAKYTISLRGQYLGEDRKRAQEFGELIGNMAKLTFGTDDANVNLNAHCVHHCGPDCVDVPETCPSCHQPIERNAAGRIVHVCYKDQKEQPKDVF